MDQRTSQLSFHNKIDYLQSMNQMPTTQLYKIQHQKKIDCFTIALGKETGTTFPVNIHNQQVNALYDTGAGCSLINYSMYETLGINLDKSYQPIVKSSTGENMGALGQITFTFKINNTTFTQSFSL